MRIRRPGGPPADVEPAATGVACDTRSCERPAVWRITHRTIDGDWSVLCCATCVQPDLRAYLPDNGGQK